MGENPGRARAFGKMPQLPLDLPRQPNIVRVDRRDNRIGQGRKTARRRAARPGILLPKKSHRYARRRNGGSGIISRAIVNDDDLFRQNRLRSNRPQRVANGGGSIERWNDNAVLDQAATPL